jgi:hypothetical protein
MRLAWLGDRDLRLTAVLVPKLRLLLKGGLLCARSTRPDRVARSILSQIER